MNVGKHAEHRNTTYEAPTDNFEPKEKGLRSQTIAAKEKIYHGVENAIDTVQDAGVKMIIKTDDMLNEMKEAGETALG